MSDYITEEIQIEILKLLPVRSLLRFRCVCQWWKQLIDSPSFLQQHLAVQKPRFIIEYPDPNPPFIGEYSDSDADADVDPYLKPKRMEPKFIDVDPRSLPLFDTLLPPNVVEPEELHLLGTHHGIVCLHYYYRHSIYLWNPWIRKLSDVPFPLLIEFHEFEWQRDPDIDASGTYLAFWIEPSTKDFKIIIFELVYHEGDGRDGVFYSSIEGNWKFMPIGEVRNCKPSIECPAIVIGGVAHWRSYYEITNEEGDEVGMNVVLLSFDFGQERFEVSTAPSINYLTDPYHPQLCNWQGSLSLVYVNSQRRCDLYARQEGVWVNVFAFDLPTNIARVVWVDPGERQENIRIIATTRDELVVWDAKAGCIPLTPMTHDYSQGVFMAYDFVESFLFIEE